MSSKNKKINQRKIKQGHLWSVYDITVITFSLYRSVATMMKQCYYDCNNNAVTLKTILFKYKMRPKGITGNMGTAPYTQFFAILKKAMCYAVEVCFISGDL